MTSKITHFMSDNKRIVIALGGNAMQQPGQKGTHEIQISNVQAACEQIYKIYKSGWHVVLTSGNGPQVGAIKLQNAESAKVSPEMPLFCCGAMSQGLIGYWMQQSFGNILRREKQNDVNVATIITQTIVSKDDSAFQNPTKPVGKFYTKEEADALMAADKSLVIKEDAGRGYRVVVPSPKPQKIVEAPIIDQLSQTSTIVICTNGGGIPVTDDGKGQLEGVDSVIDKDLATSLLAAQLGVSMLVILTDVESAFINYKQPDEKAIRDIKVDEIIKIEKEGHFRQGSMAPKVRAAIEFVEKTGGTAIITSLTRAVDALEGKCGTRITK